jgi:hypothetical protein
MSSRGDELACARRDHRDGNLLRLQNDPRLVSGSRAHSGVHIPIR